MDSQVIIASPGKVTLKNPHGLRSLSGPKTNQKVRQNALLPQNISRVEAARLPM